MTAAAIAGEGETIVREEHREISILLARKELTITRARYAPGERVAGAHVHRTHTDAFYVLEGDLTFEIGCERQIFSVSAGAFVAAPPGVAHSVRTDGDGPARWLTIHAHDGGFAAFMRGVRDGVTVEWDIAPVPGGGGRRARDAIVRYDGRSPLNDSHAGLQRLIS
ncbi:MAG: cupin domain-containing protein [Gaiellaceae bacterium]|nr:cupin domain-containing protein [Acidobacteriota bacterium]